MDEQTERASIMATMKAIEQVSGKPPVGWHTRSSPSPNTRRILSELGFVYDSDAYNDDTPYFVAVGAAKHLVLPYAFDTNDMHFQHSDRFSTAEQFSQYVCEAYDWLEQEGQCWPRMLSIGLHSRIIGRPGRIGALLRLLDYIQGHDAVWLCSRAAIARHWIEHHPWDDQAATA
jgi:peptidoglycan/xylan/chitin deacetylase (PgdA/CDA1 family)